MSDGYTLPRATRRPLSRGVPIDHLRRKPNKTYDNNDFCLVCASKGVVTFLSRYNPNRDTCWAHTPVVPKVPRGGRRRASIHLKEFAMANKRYTDAVKALEKAKGPLIQHSRTGACPKCEAPRPAVEATELRGGGFVRVDGHCTMPDCDFTFSRAGHYREESES